VTAYIEEPSWTHDPSEHLLRISEEHGGKLAEVLELESLRLLAEDAKTASPWHVWSTYGRVEDGARIASVDLCTREVAEDLLKRARRSYETAVKFFRRTSVA